jgi:Nif-specific regulatory protein
MQVKLLRVLQENTFFRVGGVVPVQVDVRIISATNKHLEKLVEEGHFREDLYYRLNVVRLHLPPLRERKEDIPLLVNFFLERIRSSHGPTPEEVSGPAMELMKNYHWPGNIRQLENALERAAIMCDKKVIQPEDLPFELTNPSDSEIELGLSLKGAQDRFKRDYIKRTMLRMNGNKTKTAKVLDIQRTYLSRLIKELEIKNP